MKIAMRVFAFAAMCLLCASATFADETTIGVTLNGTTGHHVESDRTESIPFLPLPMFELDHTHGNLRVHLELVPPIGPIPLAQSDGFGGSQDPRVSFLNGELLYASPLLPVSLGVGETVLNQRTLYPGTPFVQSSRVVGVRYIARAILYTDARQRVEASVAVNPAMQGLQYTAATGPGIYATYNGGNPFLPHGEYASLFDSSVRWTIDEGRYAIAYGVRYLNYTAAYSETDQLADRNHLFMPFVGVDFYGKRKALLKAPVAQSDPPALKIKSRRRETTFGISLLGTNGNRTTTNAYSDTPLNFTLAPMLSVDHRFNQFELLGEAILPNASTNPFGTSFNTTWSDLSVDGLVQLDNSRIALGLGETVTNLQPARPAPYVKSSTRSEALDLVGRVTLAQSLRSRLEFNLRLNPYVHVTGITNYDFPGERTFSSVGIAHGARFDSSIQRTVAAGRFQFNYGLRYINQTTCYFGCGGSYPYLTRSTSLMPFVGIKIRR